MTHTEFKKYLEDVDEVFEHTLDFHAYFGLSCYVWIVARHGSIYKILETHDPTLPDHLKLSYSEPALVSVGYTPRLL